VRAVVILAIVLVLVIGAVVFARGRNARPLPLAPAGERQRALAAELRRDVERLCARAPRNTFVPANLHAAADDIVRELEAAGYRVTRQTFAMSDGATRVDNIEAELRGATRPEEIVVIGAHYDAVDDAPGADDNASGTAAMLALARRFAQARPARTLRFVAFANEEPPHFQTRDMGSWQYARRCSERKEKIVAMVSLESVGYYDTRKGSQQYPQPLAALYPDTGDFIGLVGNVKSAALVNRCKRAYRKQAAVPLQTAVLPEAVPGAGWSDQWAFWQFGYPAVMVTDTALFRNPHYHTRSDTPDTLDYDRMSRVVEALEDVVRELGGVS
jgi:hypothetical protein